MMRDCWRESKHDSSTAETFDHFSTSIRLDGKAAPRRLPSQLERLSARTAAAPPAAHSGTGVCRTSH